MADVGEGSFLSHLLELRNRLLYALATIGALFVVLVFFAQDLYVIVARPIVEALPEGSTMIVTGVASPFLTPIKLTLWASFILAVPFTLYQVWAFVAPGLYRHEQRLVWPLLVSSTLLFYLGMAFAYFVVFPLAFSFFTGFTPEGVQNAPGIQYYLDFILSMFVAFGVAFEIPIAIILLSRAGVVNPDTLFGKWPYVIVWTFVLAMLLTPPDVFSQTFLAMPMLILFFGGTWIARWMKHSTPDSDEPGADEMTDEEMDQEMESFEQESQDKK